MPKYGLTVEVACAGDLLRTVNKAVEVWQNLHGTSTPVPSWILYIGEVASACGDHAAAELEALARMVYSDQE